MSNISFTNPYLLFVGLGLIIVVAVLFFILVRKQGFNFHSITSLILHFVICILVGLALAQMTLNLVITETNVYVLADVSYSSNKNLDKVDEYINDLQHNLPNNSKMGVICYGRDYELLVKAGDKLKSVKSSKVDNSETNVRPALEYATTLFDNSAIKRIVIISDGKETDESNMSGLVNDYYSQGIHIDAIYIDNNITSDVKEMQISNVEADNSAYKNDSSTAIVTVEANQDVAAAYLRLYNGDSLQEEKIVELTKGSNSFNFNLNTDNAGLINYKVELSEYKTDDYNVDNDTNELNNTYIFSQNVSDNIRVLYIGNSFDLNEREKYNDKEQFEKLYNTDEYDITYYTDTNSVPYTLEELCKYDEIVLANVDARKLNNSDYFMTNLDKAVSEYGKSLITIGNTYIQNKNESETDAQKDVLTNLEMMLPIKYASDDSDKRLYTLVMDVSKSLYFAERFDVAKKAACSIIDNLTENDDLYIITFYGDVLTVFNINAANESNKNKAKNIVNDLTPKQSTSLGAALQYTYDNIYNKTSYSKKEVMVISDGAIYGGDSTNIETTSKKFSDANIHVSTLYVSYYENETGTDCDNLKKISTIGRGKFYQVWPTGDVNVVLEDIADDIKETYKSSKDGYTVSISKPKDKAVTNISSIEKVYDFYVGNTKTTATTILEINDYDNKFPLYATWKYGEGKVSSFSTSLRHWKEDSNGYKVSGNVVKTNTPSNLNRTPYLFEISQSGSYTNITVTTSSINMQANVTLKITYPSGNVVEKTMSFDSVNYISSYKANEIGTYKIEFTYELGNLKDTVTQYDSLSYFPEYDAFESYDSANLYTFITSDGNVSEDGKLTISNEGLQMTTYKYEFAPLFMIISCVLFVIDIAIRKLRWQDIKDLFSKKKKVNS